MPWEVIIMKSQLEIKVRKELVKAMDNAFFYARQLQYYKKHNQRDEIERSYASGREFDQIVYTLCNILEKQDTYRMFANKMMRIGNWM